MVPSEYLDSPYSCNADVYLVRDQPDNFLNNNVDDSHRGGVEQLHCLVDVFPVWRNRLFFNSLYALSYYGNDIIAACDMWALSLGRIIKIISMSMSVRITQLNENCSNNREQQTKKLELMCYYSAWWGIINWRRFHTRSFHIKSRR